MLTFRTLHFRALLNFLLPGKFFICSLLVIFQNQPFTKKKTFRNTIWVSNRSDTDQVRHSDGIPVGPDLGPNCLQKLSADDTKRQRVNAEFVNDANLYQNQEKEGFASRWIHFHEHEGLYEHKKYTYSRHTQSCFQVKKFLPYLPCTCM